MRQVESVLGIVPRRNIPLHKCFASSGESFAVAETRLLGRTGLPLVRHPGSRCRTARAGAAANSIRNSPSARTSTGRPSIHQPISTTSTGGTASGRSGSITSCYFQRGGVPASDRGCDRTARAARHLRESRAPRCMEARTAQESQSGAVAASTGVRHGGGAAKRCVQPPVGRTPGVADGDERVTFVVAGGGGGCRCECGL